MPHSRPVQDLQNGVRFLEESDDDEGSIILKHQNFASRCQSLDAKVFATRSVVYLLASNSAESANWVFSRQQGPHYSWKSSLFCLRFEFSSPKRTSSMLCSPHVPQTPKKRSLEFSPLSLLLTYGVVHSNAGKCLPLLSHKTLIYIGSPFDRPNTPRKLFHWLKS
jgi:hypothetical protein